MASFQGAGAGLPLFPPPPGNSTLPFSSSSSAAALPRGRSTSTIGSCTNCRRGHKRCGTERPCKTCIDSGRADSCADGMTAYQASGSGRRRGSSTAAAGRLPAAVSTSMDLDWSTPLGSTSFSQQLPSLSYSTSSSSSLSALSNSSFGSLDFSLGPLALPASSSLSSFSSGLPALPSALSTSTAAKQSVYFVLGTDMKIGRVSEQSLKALGYHAHEMVTQNFGFYLQARDRPKLDSLVSSMVRTPFQAGLACPVSPIILQRLPLSSVIAPMPGLFPLSTQLKFRNYNKAYIPCSLELYLGAGCGGSLSDPERVVLVAKLEPLSSASAGGRRPSAAQTGTAFPPTPRSVTDISLPPFSTLTASVPAPPSMGAFAPSSGRRKNSFSRLSSSLMGGALTSPQTMYPFTSFDTSASGLAGPSANYAYAYPAISSTSSNSRRPRSPSFSHEGHSSFASGSGSLSLSSGMSTSMSGLGLTRPRSASPGTSAFRSSKRRASGEGSMPLSASTSIAAPGSSFDSTSSFGTSSGGLPLSMSMTMDFDSFGLQPLSMSSSGGVPAHASSPAAGAGVGKRKSSLSRNTWPPFPATSGHLSSPSSATHLRGRQASLTGGPGRRRQPSREDTYGSGTNIRLPPLSSWAPEPMKFDSTEAAEAPAARRGTSSARRGSLF